MFEEVPRERRGLGRWLLAHSVGFGQFRFGTTVPRPVVLRPLVTRPLVLRPLAIGPFVLGGGMLLAAVGGSVAVAAAATVLTASAIGSSGDVPPHPVSVSVSGPAKAPATHAAPTHAAPVPDRQPRAALPAGSAHRASGAVRTGAPVAIPAVSPTATAVSTPTSSAPAVSSPTGTPAAPVAPPVSASTDAAPSSSGPVGNALVHVSGYNQATGRLAYQFAVPGADGKFAIGSAQTFSAVLAPGASIVSGGTLCPPAGSSCTPDELIAASGAGFFAELAIDASGAVRSVVEVGDQATPRRVPGPSGSPAPASSLPS